MTAGTRSLPQYFGSGIVVNGGSVSSCVAVMDGVENVSLSPFGVAAAYVRSLSSSEKSTRFAKTCGVRSVSVPVVPLKIGSVQSSPICSLKKCSAMAFSSFAPSPVADSIVQALPISFHVGPTRQPVAGPFS